MTDQEKIDNAMENFSERVRLAAEAFDQEIEEDGVQKVLVPVGVVVVVAKDMETYERASGVAENLTDALWATMEHAEQAAEAAGITRDDFLITLA